jgi:hypothetical protein
LADGFAAATDSALPEEDWLLNFDVVDMVQESQNGSVKESGEADLSRAVDAVMAIVRQLQTDDVKVLGLTLTVRGRFLRTNGVARGGLGEELPRTNL